MQLIPRQIRPEGLLPIFGEWLGDQDINFPQHPEFSRLYVLQSNEPKGA